MGPLSVYLIHTVMANRSEQPAFTGEMPGETHFTLVQLKCLRGVNKGSIRTETLGTLALCEGTDGFGQPLHRVRYNPIHLKSWRNARLICQEIARMRYHFDLLFMDNHPDDDRVHVLCPHCQTYWTWHETIPNDLKRVSGRICRTCRRRSGIAGHPAC